MPETRLSSATGHISKMGLYFKSIRKPLKAFNTFFLFFDMIRVFLGLLCWEAAQREVAT